MSSVDEISTSLKYRHVEPGSYYDSLVRNDIIGKLLPLFENGTLSITVDGRIIQSGMAKSGSFLAWNTPWIHRNIDGWRHCDYWHLMFGVLNFVPQQCRDCWKVVITPLTLKQLFVMEAFQATLGVSCKCGIEVRSYTRKFYGAYWYNQTKKAGEECYAQLKAKMQQIGLGDCPIILKRYCTEMERALGPTKQYKKPPDQDHWEKMIESHVVMTCSPTVGQPEFLKRHLRRRWIEFAWRNGDPTVYEYTGGKDVFAPLDTYHDEIDAKMGDIEAQVKNVKAGHQPNGEVTSPKKPKKAKKRTVKKSAK